MPTYPTYKLGDVAEILDSFRKPINSTERAKRIQGKNEIELYPYYGATGQVGLIDEYLTDGEYVLVGEDGAPFLDPFKNKSYIIKGKAWVNNHAHIISGKKGVSCNQYLNYFLNSFDYKDYVNGTTRLKLTQGNLVEIPIPLPPLPTQHQIVSRIESLFAELDKAEAHLRTAQQQLKTYRQAVLKSAFEECTNFEKIINYFDVTGGLTKNSQREKFPIKMPYLRVANVYFNRLDLSEIKEIGIQESEVKEKLLKKGDLLFVEGNGSKEQIGRVAIWDGSVENCLHQNHIIKGRPRGQVSSKYALYYLISDLGREQIVEVASSTSGLYTLSTDKVRNLKIPYIPLSEQQRIAEEIESRLSQAEAAEARIAESLQKTEALRQSILKKAFSGELV